MKKSLILLTTLFTLAGFWGALSSQGSPVKLKMASGFAGGTYDKMTNALSAVPGLQVSNRVTTGSEENIQLIMQKLADVAFVQTDAYKSAKLRDRNLRRKVKMLFPVFSEELHLIVNKKVTNLNRLKGAKISIGALNSGTAVTSKIVLQILNVKYPATSAAIQQNMKTEDAIKKVQSGQISAMFLVSGSPVSILSGLPASAKKNISLYSFDITETDLLTDNYFYYKNATIPSSDYPWIDSDVKTVGVETLLIARNDLSDEDVRFLMHGIYSNQLELSEKHVKWKDTDFRQLVKFKARTKMIDYHPAVYSSIDELSKKLN